MNRINVTRSSMPPIEEFFDEIKTLWDSHWITNMGDKHVEFQKELTDYLGVDNIELLVNGHMSLEMTIQAFGFPPGSEVITTPFTFASTTHAIVRNGLKPVFCDISEKDYLIDCDLIEKLITDKTVAILPVHVYGNICDVERIDEISKKYGLKVVYDAAHSFGEKYKGIGVGNFGDASCFSFHATKVFNSIEGGASCYRDEKIGSKIYDLKNFGIHGLNDVFGIGANAKMNEFCAAMGICNLRHVDDEIIKRKKVFDRYSENLKEVEGIVLPSIQQDVYPNYAYYPILINEKKFKKSRDELYDDLIHHNIYARKYFYPLTSDFECYKNIYNSSKTPKAKFISDRVLTLPMYSDLDLSNVDIICEIILE